PLFPPHQPQHRPSFHLTKRVINPPFSHLSTAAAEASCPPLLPCRPIFLRAVRRRRTSGTPSRRRPRRQARGNGAHRPLDRGRALLQLIVINIPRLRSSPSVDRAPGFIDSAGRWRRRVGRRSSTSSAARTRPSAL